VNQEKERKKRKKEEEFVHLLVCISFDHLIKIQTGRL
jgi:hypothetical protein